MEYLITTFGYAFIFLGTFLEGETIVIIAGFLAHRGYLHLSFVIMTAFAGSFFGDQLYFLVGRYRGQLILKKRPSWQIRIDSFMTKLNRYTIPLVLSFRFLYGFRTIAPFAIGLSKISGFLFLTLNFLSGIGWAVVFGCAGYFFGYTMERIIDDVQKFETIIIGLIAGIAISITVLRKIRNKSILSKMKNKEQ